MQRRRRLPGTLSWRAAAALLALIAAPAAAESPTIQWTAEQRAYLDAKGSIRMCVDPNWAPLESVDDSGRHIGIGADFIALMAQRGGLQIERVPTGSWSESLVLAQQRGCDIFSMASRSAERESFMDFTTPYVIVPNVIVTRLDEPLVGSIDQVANHTLGALRSTTSVTTLRKTYPGIDLVEVDSYAEGLLRVQSGELYALLGNMAGIGYAFQQNGILDLKIAGWTGQQSDTSVGTRSDEPLLGGIFQTLVDSITAEEKQEILNRWLAVRFEQGFDNRLIWRGLAIGLPIALLVLIWALTLRRLNRRLKEANQQLAELSRRDGLTGVHNRRYFDEELPNRVQLCSRHRLTFALAMIDIDRFKGVNDRFGHPFGDAALRQVATLIRQTFRRSSDLVARYGGEEFVVLAVGKTEAEVLDRLETLRQRVAEARIEHGGQSTGLTISIGVSVGVPATTAVPLRLTEAADSALYRAKEGGRNRVEVEPTAD